MVLLCNARQHNATAQHTISVYIIRYYWGIGDVMILFSKWNFVVFYFNLLRAFIAEYSIL